MKRFLVVILTAISCIMMSQVLLAQDVDKKAVLEQADAAKKVKDDLIKLPTDSLKPWKFTGVIGLNASAAGFVNWAAGGKNNVNGIAFANLRLLYAKNRLAWDTNLDTDFGYSFLDQAEDPWQKTNDKIVFTTKFGYEVAKQWYVTAVGSFRSQYAFGYDYIEGDNPVLSKWLAPSYTDISVGVDWMPNDIFTLYLSPLAGRITTVVVPDSLSDLKINYGVTMRDADGNIIASDKDYRAELGLIFKGGVSYSRIKNFKVISTVSLFTPYSSEFGNFDVDWDLSVSYQFLKVLNVKLGTSLKYYNSVLIADKDGNNPVQRVQFNTVLGLGIGYSF